MAARDEGVLDVPHRDPARAVEAGAEGVEVERVIKGDERDLDRRLHEVKQGPQSPEDLREEPAPDGACRRLYDEGDGGHAGHCIGVVARRDVLDSALLELRPLCVVAPPPPVVQAAHVLGGHLVAVSAEVARGLPTVVVPGEGRVHVGLAARAAQRARLAEVYERDRRLVGRELGEGLADHRDGHVRGVHRGGVGRDLVDRAPHELA
mmetsp:Transcript_55485/g.146086  ORF Transcript_55485/g.146086 Transcript_55485/m.146086 type:complete len:207 (+) Transcript_55485:1956-2576(+)